MSVELTILKDTASPAVAEALPFLLSTEGKLDMARACVNLTQDHLRSLGPNKRGWPSTGFYAKAAAGTTARNRADGFAVLIDNDDAPGAMRQRYHGGKITAKDKLLAIPARPEFAGVSPTEFTNLRFIMFASGAKAFVVGKGGVGRVDFETGREKNVRGAGVRAEALVAYWLVDEVDQDADEGVLPSDQEYLDVIDIALHARFAKFKAGGANG